MVVRPVIGVFADVLLQNADAVGLCDAVAHAVVRRLDEGGLVFQHIVIAQRGIEGAGLGDEQAGDVDVRILGRKIADHFGVRVRAGLVA